MGFLGDRIYEHKQKLRKEQLQSQTEPLIQVIILEAKNYNQKMQDSTAIKDLARVVFKEGAPEYIIVHTYGVQWQPSPHGTADTLKTLYFEHIGCPNLNDSRKFSVDDKWRRDYDIPTEMLFHTSGDLRGLCYYDDGDYDASYYKPCIDECFVVGMILCQQTSTPYSYEQDRIGGIRAGQLKFRRQYPITKSW